MTTKKDQVNKDTFLTILKTMSVKDMQNYIESKGKEPKMFNPMIHYRKTT